VTATTVTIRPAPPWAAVATRAAGIIGLLVIWSVCAELLLRNNDALPPPWTVARQMVDDIGFYGPHLRQTLGEAGWGYVWGNLGALVLGVVFVLFGVVEKLAARLVVAVYCLPLIATAPILQLIFAGDRAKIAVAAQAVFFTTLVGVTLGLRSSDRVLLDAVRASGGGAWQQLVRVRIRSSVPAVFAALKIAAPAALLGAVIGEFLGGSRGIGVAMIASQQAFDVPRTWGLAVLLTLLSAAVYVLTGAVGARLAPWPETSTRLGDVAPRHDDPLVKRTAIATAYLAASIALIVFAWWAALELFDLSPFFAKRPGDVWEFLAGPDGAANRSVLFGELATTLKNAGLGFLAGTGAAIVLALLVAGNRVVEQAVMPVAIGLRSVPLVALTPLVALVFGRGIACVLVIAGIVTFFPTLVQLVDGLRNAPRPAYDVVRAFGGEATQQLTRVQLPYALPSLFASIRIAAPLALIGATLAEWLATGQGIGSHMVLSLARSKYVDLWASVALLTACAVAVYGIASTAEGIVLRRFQGTP
jgi:sulfonate transport system permease protein